jgi:hypothetical protein
MKYCRVCSVTGKGMNEGWYFENTGDYTATKEATVQLLREHYPEYKDIPDDKLIDVVYDAEGVYWTQWEYEEEIEDQEFYYTEDGVEISI